MKQASLLFAAILLSVRLFSQDLPTNPATGLVSITDSVDLKGKTVNQVKEAMANWGHTLLV